MNVNVTKHFKGILPKIKGYKFEVRYDTEGLTDLGNIKVYLWTRLYKGMNIVGSGYATVWKQDSHLAVRDKVADAAARAVLKAQQRGNMGRNGVPDNITGRN